MNTARDLLLADAEQALLRIVRTLVGTNDHNEAFAAWLLRPYDGSIRIDGPAQVAINRPVGQKNYRDVATLGFAAAADGPSFSHKELLKHRILWLAGRDLSVAGSPAGFVSDAIALLGTALGANAVGDAETLRATASWMETFARDSFDGKKADDREKYLVSAALRLVGDDRGCATPGGESFADVRVALRDRELLAPVHQVMVDSDEAAAIRLMLGPSGHLSPLQAALRLAAYHAVKRSAQASHRSTVFCFPTESLTRADVTSPVPEGNPAMSEQSSPPKIFVSYTWEGVNHNDKAVGLANSLRHQGLETMIDAYISGSPAGGWPIWMLNQVKNSDYVLVACTDAYRRRCERDEKPGTGKGAKWEGAIITQSIYENDSNNEKFIPVVFKAEDLGHIPLMLKGATHYDLSKPEQYEKLYRRLTNQPLIVPPPVGAKLAMPPRDIKPFKPGT